jgi:hypothetical protein
VPTHPIRDDEQTAFLVGIGVETVLVASANAPDISAGGDGKLHV